jgi:hypothetical protein
MVVLLFASCAEEELPTANQNVFTNTTVLPKVLRDNAPEVQQFKHDPSSTFSFKTQGGLVFTFPQNAFVDGSGNVVSGNVGISVTEYLSKADMINSGVTTSSGNKLLESGGMFHIKVEQGGAELQLATGSVYQVNFPTDNYQSDMQVFAGREVVDGEQEVFVDWELAQGSWIDVNDSNQQARDSNYMAFVNVLSWCNLDKYIDASSGSQVRLKLPEGYGNANTLVYMVFDGNSVVYLFSDKDKKEFNSGSYILPLGWDIKLLAVYQDDDDMEYGLIDSKIVEDHLETITSMTKIDEDGLKALIEAL